MVIFQHCISSVKMSTSHCSGKERNTKALEKTRNLVPQERCSDAIFGIVRNKSRKDQGGDEAAGRGGATRDHSVYMLLRTWGLTVLNYESQEGREDSMKSLLKERQCLLINLCLRRLFLLLLLDRKHQRKLRMYLFFVFLTRPSQQNKHTVKSFSIKIYFTSNMGTWN